MKLKIFAVTFILGSALGFGSLPAFAADDPSPLQGQVVFGGNLTVPKGQTQESAVAFGGNVVVDGTVTQDVVAFGGNVVINGSVGHDVNAVGGNVTLGPQSNVGHNVSIVGGQLNRAEGAQVGGQVVSGHDGMRFPISTVSGRRAFRGLDVFFGLAIATGIVLLALLTLLFFPKQLQTAGAVVEQRPVESFALGCGGTIAGLFLALLFGITIIFSPVSFVIAIAMTAGWLFGWAALFLITGRRLLQSMNRPLDLVPAVLVGGILVGIMANIPVVKWIVIVLGGSLALGAAILSRFGTQAPAAPVAGPAAMPPAGPPPPSPSP